MGCAAAASASASSAPHHALLEGLVLLLEPRQGLRHPAKEAQGNTLQPEWLHADRPPARAPW
jgi:hypothetical protein